VQVRHKLQLVLVSLAGMLVVEFLEDKLAEVSLVDLLVLESLVPSKRLVLVFLLVLMVLVVAYSLASESLVVWSTLEDL